MPDVQLFDKTTKLVDISLRTDKPIVVHQGGTSSSKTISLLQTSFILGASEPNSIFTIAGQDIPNLKKGAYRDAKKLALIEGGEEIGSRKLREHIIDHNKGEREIKMSTGSVFEFNSYDDAQDAKSGKRDYLFVNEANGIPWDIFDQLEMRTTKQIWIDFNPTYPFWAHEKLKGRSDVLWVKSNYTHNPFIPKRIKKRIESYNPWHPDDMHLPKDERRPHPVNIKNGTANEYNWLVYGLGETGRLEGLVFDNFEVTREWPQQYKWRVFGLDFGFTNDPTALVEIRYVHGALYWRQHIYQTGMVNQDICLELTRIDFPEGERITADSAEPKSIKEIRIDGWNVVGAEKGPDSVMHGINNIQSYPIKIYHKSKNLIEEFNSYTWEKDKDGNHKNKPIDKFNHGIDAGRYALEKQLSNNFFVV